MPVFWDIVMVDRTLQEKRQEASSPHCKIRNERERAVESSSLERESGSKSKNSGHLKTIIENHASSIF
jgi:hypothetical protein